MQVYYNHEAFFMMKFLFVLLLFCLLHVSREASGLEFGNVRAMFGGEGVVAGRKLELTIPMEPAGRWPGVALIPEGGGRFDFNGCREFRAEVSNLNAFPAQLQVEIVRLKRGSGKKEIFLNKISGGIGLAPGERAMLRVPLIRSRESGFAPQGLRCAFEGFNCRENHLPADGMVDEIRFFVKDPCQAKRFRIGNLHLAEKTAPLPEALESAETFYPCLDRFGQYRHSDWPGKLKDVSEWKIRAADEERDLAAHPAPAERTRFGGWTGGPQLEATGGFRVEKYRGKWFFADPEGRLLWLFGVNRCDLSEATGVTRREHCFEALPPRCRANEWTYYAYPGALRLGFYKGSRPRSVMQVSFLGLNLMRKLGVADPEADGRKAAYDYACRRIPERLRSWGFNAFGNSCSQQIVRAGRMPYAHTAHQTRCPQIAGAHGNWANFDDVFSPDYAGLLARNLKQDFGEALQDPYCIGLYVHNEIGWGRDDADLARGVLRSPASQPAKQEFRRMLEKKYGSIGRLNAVWKTEYPSWEAFLFSAAVPADRDAWADLNAFNMRLVHTYFASVRQAMREIAPGKLYLGCRFTNNYRNSIVRIAAEYCDVLSFNFYKYSIGTFRLPKGIDKPVIIGEFHFGTPGYGPEWAGLCAVAGQEERARAFDRYVRSALYNPAIVGVQYFQLYDQPALGRTLDGENGQVGFLDVTDTPYPAMVEASRRLGGRLYRERLSAVPAGK